MSDMSLGATGYQLRGQTRTETQNGQQNHQKGRQDDARSWNLAKNLARFLTRKICGSVPDYKLSYCYSLSPYDVLKFVLQTSARARNEPVYQQKQTQVEPTLITTATSCRVSERQQLHQASASFRLLKRMEKLDPFNWSTVAYSTSGIKTFAREKGNGVQRALSHLLPQSPTYATHAQQGLPTDATI